MILWFLLLLEPDLRRACTTLELIGPHEYCRPHELWGTACQNYRDLRDAPSLAEADLLPDHATCVRNVWLLDRRICAVEKYREYFGQSRWEEFEPALLSLRKCRGFWVNCEVATGTDRWVDRRLAPKRLRDN